MLEMAKLDTILDRHAYRRDHLIGILLDCQQQFRYLPREVIEGVASGIGTPVSQVLGAATFYRRFSLTPVGRYPVSVCMGTACHVQGGPRLLEAFERELKVRTGEATPDMQFSLHVVNCLGCCGLAPVITVGDDVHGRLKQSRIRRIVSDYQAKST